MKTETKRRKWKQTKLNDGKSLSCNLASDLNFDLTLPSLPFYHKRDYNWLISYNKAHV